MRFLNAFLAFLLAEACFFSDANFPFDEEWAQLISE
jgi:hypothetical protein